MADLDALRAHLGRGSSVAGDGEFTIDSQRARDKLRDFQLADPRTYVILLVQVATLLGATQIRFTLDSDDLIAEFDGRPILYAELEDLYAQLFIDAHTADQRARQRLALALNAAVSLHPRSIQLTSHGPQGGVRLELRPNQPDRLSRFDPTARAQAGTTIHVKERRSLARIGGYLANNLDEARLLRQACAFARISVRIGEEVVARSWDELGFTDSVDLTGDGLRGRAGLLGEARPNPFGGAEHGVAVVDLLLHGVHVARRRLPQALPSRLRVVLDCDDLRDDLSLTNIVEDSAYTAAMAAALPALDRCVAQLCRQHRRSPDPDLLRLIEHYLERTWPVLGRDRDAWRAYADLPRWPALDGRLRSTAELDAMPEVGTTTVKPSLPLPDYGHIILPDRGDLDLNLVLRSRLRDLTAEIQRAELAERNRQAWRTRPREPRLYSKEAGASATLDEVGVRGELALRPGAAGPTHLTLIAAGCTLCNLLPDLPIHGVDAVLAADFRPNATYDGVLPSPALAAAAVLLLRGLDQLIQRIAASYGDSRSERDLPPAALHRYIVHLSRGDALVNLLRSLGFRGPDAVHLESVVHLPPPVLDLHPNSQQPLVHIPLFRSTLGYRLSLYDLAQRRARGERIAVLADTEQLVPEFDEPCLSVDTAERALLTQVFGDALEGRERALASARRRAEHRRRPVDRQPLQDMLTSVDFSEGAFSGRIGVTAEGLRAHSPFDVTLLVDQRSVAAYKLQTQLPGLKAVLHTDDLDHAPASDLQLLPDHPLARALAVGVAALIAALLRDRSDRATILRPLLTGALATIYGTPEARRKDELSRRSAPDLADHALRVHIREDQRSARADAFHSALRLALLEHLTELRATAIFPTIQGPARGLDQLQDNPAHIAALPAPLRHSFGSPQQICGADLSAGADPNLPPEPAVLALRSATIAHLSALFELHHLDSAQLRTWRGHNLARRRPPEIATALACQIRLPEATGTIGLPLDPGLNEPVLYIQRGGWLIAHFRADSPLPLVGQLEGPELDLDPQGDGLSERALSRLPALARHATVQLVHALIRAWERPPVLDRAFTWLLRALIHLLDPERDSDAAEDEARERLADLPLFPVLGGGQRCFRELHALQQLDGFLHCAPAGVDLPATYPVLLIDPDVAGLYAQLFPDLRLFPALLTGAARDPLPQPGPGTLHVQPFAVESLRGQLWLDPAPHFWLEINLGSDARLDQTLVEPTLLPAIFAGERDDAAPDAPLDRAQLAALTRAVVELHAELLRRYTDSYQRAREQVSPLPLAQRQRALLGGRDPAELRRFFVALRDHLEHLLDCGLALDPAHAAFYQSLEQAPILELPGGRIIDPSSARQRGSDPPPQPVEAPAEPRAAASPPPPPPTRADAPAPPPPPPRPPPPTDAAPGQAPLPPPLVQPSPEDLLLRAVRDELRLLTPDPHDHLYFDALGLSDAAALVELRGEAVTLAYAHPVVQRALAGGPDAALCASLLASAVFTALNARYARITDADEAAFHRRHAAHLLSA